MAALSHHILVYLFLISFEYFFVALNVFVSVKAGRYKRAGIAGNSSDHSLKVI
jgi:hypothetical protein